MNTGKQINAMVVVLFLTLISLGVYTIWDPFRSDAAEDDQLEMTVHRGAETFALNCRVCHGDAGQGGVEGGRLGAAVPLDRPDLQGIENGQFSPAAYDATFDFVFNTITCGRVGSPMPVWGEEHGGTLNEEQIRQLTLLILEGRWELAQEAADHIDAEATQFARLAMPDGMLDAESNEIFVDNPEALTLGQYIRIRIDEESEERLRILPNLLEVERGVDGTEAADHDVGAAIALDDGEATGETVAEEMDDDQEFVVVGERDAFSEGDVIQVEDERMRVTGLATGIPTTGQVLAADVGREPSRLLVSGSEGIETGQIIRLDGELMEVIEIGERDTGHNIAGDVSAGDDAVPVSMPTFFGPDYVFRAGDELMRVIGPVEIDQLLSEDIGRAETRILLTGSAGIEEGMVIRMGEELIRVAEILRPAGVQIERGVNETQATSHPPGTEFVALPVEETQEGQAEGTDVAAAEAATQAQPEEPTGRALIEAIDPTSNVAIVSNTTGLNVDETYRLGDEVVRVRDSRPAILRVERGVEGTDADDQARRAQVFLSNLLEVERGVQGTSAQAHRAGDDIVMAELRVDRAVQDSALQDHSKNAEVFLGNGLIVERGVLQTEPAEHENGQFVMDFPQAPDDPPNVLQSCGQRAVEGDEEPVAEETPLPDAPLVETSLIEWDVLPDMESVAAGPVSFEAVNDGTAVHNLRIIQTDLAPDALPVVSNAVDEAQLNVVARSPARIEVGESAVVNVPDMAAGSYVLICNIPTHYEQGMFTAFQVIAP